MRFLVVGFPRAVTSRVYVELCRKSKPSICIFEPLHDVALLGALRRGYVMHDVCGRVPSTAPRSLLQAWLYEARRFLAGRARIEKIGKLLAYTFKLSNVVVKDVFLWIFPTVLLSLDSSVKLIFTMRDISEIYRDFMKILSESFDIFGIVRDSRNIKTILAQAWLRYRRARTMAGLGVMCRYFCSRPRCRELDMVITCLFNKYLDNVEKCSRERNVEILDFSLLSREEVEEKVCKIVERFVRNIWLL